MNLERRSIAACCVVVIGCIEVPDPGPASDLDGGRPLLVALPPTVDVSVQGGCLDTDQGPGRRGGPPSAGAGPDAGLPSSGGAALLAEDGGAGWRPPAAAGDLLITEFMADPSRLSDTEGEWFELHNPGDTGFELVGCEVAEGDAPGAFIEGTLGIGPGAYAAISRRPSPGFVPAAVVAFSLKNSEDAVVLRCGAVEIDRVDYGPGYPLSPGVSAQLDPGAFGGRAAAHWCPGRDPYAGDLGTPGGPNLPCAAEESDAGVD